MRSAAWPRRRWLWWRWHCLHQRQRLLQCLALTQIPRKGKHRQLTGQHQRQARQQLTLQFDRAATQAISEQGVAGDASLTDHEPQLGGQHAHQLRHQAGQLQPQAPPLGTAAAGQLPARGGQHRDLASGDHLPQLLEPGGLQGGQQLCRGWPLQHPSHLGHINLNQVATGLSSQQVLQLGVGQRHMGAHQHHRRQRHTSWIAAAQGRQVGRMERLGGQLHQAIEQAGGGLEQEPPRPPPALGRCWSHELPHRSSQGRQLLRPLGVNHHPGARGQLGQTGAQRLVASRPRLAMAIAASIQLGQAQPLHRCGRHPATALGLDVGGQIAARVAKQAVAGKGGGVHRHALEQVNTPHRGAAPRQKRRHQQAGIDRPAPGRRQLTPGGLDHLEFKRKVPPQRRIAAAHQQQRLQPLGQLWIACGDLPQGLAQVVADLTHALLRRHGLKGAGVGQHKQQRRGVRQASAQDLCRGVQQQRATVQRLRTGGIVVEDHNLHGTIVP